MSPSLYAVQFAQASLACVVAGLFLSALLSVAARRWPALHAARTPWLAAQLLCVLALVVGSLPQQARLGLLPPVQIAAPLLLTAPASVPASDAAAINMTAAGANAGRVSAAAPADAVQYSAVTAATDWPVLAGWTWCALYLTGLLAAVLRLLQAQRATGRLLALAERDPVSRWAHLAPPLLPVYRIDLPVSPMLLKVFKPVLLLPRQFDTLGAAEQALILAHEGAHLARRDPLLRLVSVLAQALLWFNPAMARLQVRLFWAQEAGCDGAVLATRSAADRRVYAGALVAQFRLQQRAVANGLPQALAFGGTFGGTFGGAFSGAFGGAFNGPFSGPSGANQGDPATGVATLAERVRLIRDGAGEGASGAVRAVLLGTGAAAVAAILVLQPAYAWRSGALAPLARVVKHGSATALTAVAPVVRWQPPLAQLHVNSPYGSVSRLRSGVHRGVDLKARRGTPVQAVADGVVASSVDVDAAGAKYGKTITIIHADGRRSFYAHLDARAVNAGEVVRGGQTIGRSGATGKVSGPHLHFELRVGEDALDPATVSGLMTSMR